MRKVLNILLLLLFAGCAEMAPEPYEHSSGHISTEATTESETIPELVQQAPVLPEPEPPKEDEKYTVVVNEVPVKELLFALARDAQINVDIDPRIQGEVTINAVDQTLPQILDRIARQVDLRYEILQDNLVISPDEPFFRTYKVDYLHITRDTESTISTDTGVGGGQGGGGGAGGGGGGGAGGNTSTTEVTSSLVNNYWANLVQGVSAIIGDEGSGGGGGAGEIPVTNNVIPQPESGILMVRATTREHELIQQLIDNTLVSAVRQVLIQATIVEVTLNDKYQAGIDWSFVNQNGKAGFDFASTALIPTPTNTITSFILSYVDPNTSRDQVITATLRLLEEFGDVSVLSSPQIMALNSQTAILKVVDNIVYFEIEVTPATRDANGLIIDAQKTETTAKTVPVGIVLSLVPQVSENDSIILHVRPTISRVLSFVNDPNPDLGDIPNPVPQLQIREMESILRMNNGQIAVLGGLMQEVATGNDAAIPGLSSIPALGEIFKSRTRDYEKRELVIFLRPVVVRNPSIEGDLKLYKSFLERAN